MSERQEFNVELIYLLTTRFAPRPNETVQYHLFTRRRQQIGESIDVFATDLRRIADGCGFGGEAVLEKMLRNQFVCGLADTPDLTFKIAIEAAKAAEVARKYVEDVRDEATTHGAVYGIGSQAQYKPTFQRTRRQDTNHGSQPQVGNPPSIKVGPGQENRGRRARHLSGTVFEMCRATSNTPLYACDRRGHVEPVCLSETRHGRNTARAHQVTDITEPHKQDSEELSIEGLELYNIKDVSKHSVPDTKRQPTMPAIRLSLRIDGMFHTMEVDTGAALTLISEETYKVLWPHQPKLESLDLDLRTWAADTPLRLLGSKSVEVQFKEKRATLTLALATGHGPSLLGRPWFEPLGLTIHGLNVIGNTLANTEQNPTSINIQQELPVPGYRTNNKVTVQNTLLTPSEVKDLNTIVQGYPAVADPTFGEFNGPMFHLGDTVWIREYSANHPKWTQGTVGKSLGEWMYEVTNKDGRRQRRHVDQLRQASESLQTGKQQYSQREQHLPLQLFQWEDTPGQQEPDQDPPPLLERHQEMIPQQEKSGEPGQTSGQNQQATQKRGRPCKEQQQQAPCLQPVNTKHPHQPLSLQLRGRIHEPPLLRPQRIRRPNPRYDLNSALTQQIAMLTQLMSNIKAKSDDVAQMAKQAEEEDSGTGQTIEMLSNAIITDLDKSVLNEPDVVERFSQERMEVFTGIEEAVERSSTYMSEAGRYLNDLKNEMVSTLTSGESAWRKHYTHTEQDLRTHLERLGSGLQDELELTAQLADVVSVCANNNEAALERRRHTLTTFVRERQDDIVAECSYVSDWTRRTVAEVQQRAQELDRFLTEDLRKDLPTGQTPKRKEFHYPHQLVATSPHDRILERFRARSKAMMGDTQPMLDLSLETLPGFEQCNELDARELFESDGNDPGYQHLNDDEILHQVIEDKVAM
uniref:Kinesin-associated microtubule-binding domain-containing protein n=1 Tax=Timema monikensis TaxID=170555 RepID=A0A7R9HQ97_9NEOP|nr:unnamed protein product [Timema monikensis]